MKFLKYCFRCDPFPFSPLGSFLHQQARERASAECCVAWRGQSLHLPSGRMDRSPKCCWPVLSLGAFSEGLLLFVCYVFQSRRTLSHQPAPTHLIITNAIISLLFYLIKKRLPLFHIILHYDRLLDSNCIFFP